MSNQITIPENIQNICREFAKVAQQYGLNKFSGKFTPDDNLGWGGDVSFSWQQGRHGDDHDEIQIHSEYYVHTKVSASSK
jgi:hypothetical protein